MKKVLVGSMLLICCSLGLLTACHKEANSSTNRKIKYEITGNFSGKLLVVYSDNLNGSTSVANVSLPWSKEINYSSGVLSIAISGQASAAGSPGQTAVMKIYSGGTVVKTGTATAGSLGEMVLPAISYSF